MCGRAAVDCNLERISSVANICLKMKFEFLSNVSNMLLIRHVVSPAPPTKLHHRMPTPNKPRLAKQTNCKYALLLLLANTLHTNTHISKMFAVNSFPALSSLIFSLKNLLSFDYAFF